MSDTPKKKVTNFQIPIDFYNVRVVNNETNDTKYFYTYRVQEKETPKPLNLYFFTLDSHHKGICVYFHHTICKPNERRNLHKVVDYL